MVDYGAIRSSLELTTFADSEVGDVNIARRFLNDVSSITGGVRPVSTRGALYIYDNDRGVWEEIRREELLSLVQAYDGAQVGHVRRRKDGTEEAFTRPLRLSSGKCKGIHECVLTSRDA